MRAYRALRGGGDWSRVRNEMLGVNGIMVETEHSTDFVGEFWLLTLCGVGHIRALSWRFEIADNRHGAKLLENFEDDL